MSLTATATAIRAPPLRSRSRSSTQTAASGISSISRSLWPPPTPKTTITGLRPTSAAALSESMPRNLVARQVSAIRTRLEIAATAL